MHSEASDSDIATVHTLYNRFKEATSPTNSFNITLNLDTDQVRGFLFKIKAALAWPKVVTAMAPPSGNSPAPTVSATSGNVVVNFGLTQVGNHSFRDVVLENPSQQDVFYQLAPMTVYPNGPRMANLLPRTSFSQDEAAAVAAGQGAEDNLEESVQPPSPQLHQQQNFTQGPHVTVETFRVTSVVDAATKQPLKSFGDDVEAKHGSPVHPETKVFVLKSGQSSKVRIRFRPSADDFYRQALFVRNNLTGLELVELTAKGVYGELRFGTTSTMAAVTTGKMGSAAPTLKFEVKEKHLKDCKRECFMALNAY